MESPEMPSPQAMMRETEELKKRFEAISESITMGAKMIRVAFENLVKAGFTEPQALEIVKARGWSLLSGGG